MILERVMKPILLAAAFSLISGAATAAPLIYDETIVPSNGSGSTTFFDNDNDFNETFNFSSVNYTSIDSFRLTLDVSGATNESGPFQTEDWNIRVQGSVYASLPAGAADDYFDDITGDGLLSFVIDGSSDTGSVDAFLTSVNSGTFTFWLSEESAYTFWGFHVGPDNPSITISSAKLEVFGEVAAVPLPAGGLLLLTALGGLGMARRRKKAA